MLNKIKYFLSGFAVSFLMVGGASFADEAYYKLTKMDCSIVADGNNVNMDLPVLNYEGRSYLPLRSIADVTGAKIKWDADTRTINYDSVMKVEYKEVIKEIPKEVVKEVIKEVPKEVIKEIIKEVPKEVIKEKIVEKNINSYKSINYGNGLTFEGFKKEDDSLSYGEVKFSDGSIYTGSMIYSKFDGIGRMNYSNNDMYIGEYKNGVVDGTGLFFWRDSNLTIQSYNPGTKTGFRYNIYPIDNMIIAENVDNDVVTARVIYTPAK